MTDKAAMGQGCRPTWEESPELRQEVEEELRNWGRAYWDSGPKLGYPEQQPFYTPPRDARDKRIPSEPAPDADEAQRTEDKFLRWRQIADESPPHIQESIDRLHGIAVMFYVYRLPMAAVAKNIGVTRQYSYELKKELLYRYWMMSS